MIESAALAARIQASKLFAGFDIPEKPSLWAEVMNWACDAYNRSTTVANPGNRSPREMFYREIPQNSPIPFLKPGYCKCKRTNKMDPKARECMYLSPARNHPRESKRVLVHTGKVIITRHVTWAYARFGRSLITRSKPSVVGEGNESGQDREASAANSEGASEDGESVSERTRRVIETPEAEVAAPITSGRAPTPTSKARGSQCGVSIDSFGALRAGEARRLAEHIPGPLRATIFKGRTRAEERRSKNTAQTRLISEEDELDIALHVEEENTLEQTLQVDVGASVEMPTGKMQDLPPPPTTQEEVRRSPFRKAFKHSQKVQLNGLLAVRCFKVVDEKDVPKGRKVVGSRWVHTFKGDGHGNCLKTKSRVVAEMFTQVQDVDYHETTSPTPASAPVNMIAAIANEKGLPVFHLNESQALVQAPLKEEVYTRLPPGCGELFGKVVKLLKCQYGLEQVGREWHFLSVTWLVEKIRMEQCQAEPCVFRKITNNEVSMMVGVHVDDIIVSGEQDSCDEFFGQLK